LVANLTRKPPEILKFVFDQQQKVLILDFFAIFVRNTQGKGQPSDERN